MKMRSCFRLGLANEISLLTALISLALPATLQAQFTFITNNSIITITGYTGPGGVVTIPDTTNGFPVTSIGANAFNSSSVISVTIPDSVTNIGANAFYDCYYLTNVTIGTNVINIGTHAFYFCNALASVAIPNSVTSIGDYSFEFCSSLTSVAIPNGVPVIGFWTFSF